MNWTSEKIIQAVQAMASLDVGISRATLNVIGHLGAMGSFATFGASLDIPWDDVQVAVWVFGTLLGCLLAAFVSFYVCLHRNSIL